MINRPDLEYNDKKHEYRLNGEKLLGVSTVAKIGDTDIWGVASAWAFRIGYEGAHELLLPSLDNEAHHPTADELREELKQARKTPWHKTDDSKDRGNAIHSALEKLAQEGVVPVLTDYPESQRGYIQALCKWYLDYRPSFEATEVQVVSEKHLFAGRYDIRASIPAAMLLKHEKITQEESEAGPPAWLTLDDLKTGKYVYPTTQFPQLAGYELAGVEMGYTPTDAQYILNVHDDGSYDFERSTATAEHFLAYLAAQRAILDIKAKSPQKRKK